MSFRLGVQNGRVLFGGEAVRGVSGGYIKGFIKGSILGLVILTGSLDILTGVRMHTIGGNLGGNWGVVGG